ncbi:hypothetical protein MtrunA17_Chr1g0210381 [Medicago truncatula]|uniref:Transmembrane protein n=1 Tax=Medicago truncatula TaxID=3880 RepID=A0A396JZ44_MEDTR|nr:hypothetical protein MtrunA17_Chr5g0414691 [Medicago truncatula]RHN82484.1 hypothetical protein MtrunA17_Chr1g0210381 [Medicago truncatula]
MGHGSWVDPFGGYIRAVGPFFFHFSFSFLSLPHRFSLFFSVLSLTLFFSGGVGWGFRRDSGAVAGEPSRLRRRAGAKKTPPFLFFRSFSSSFPPLRDTKPKNPKTFTQTSRSKKKEIYTFLFFC